MAAVELRGVAKRYGVHVALHPTDLDVIEGKTTVLIGPSGCGKSTLLRLIIGLIKPDEGTVRVGGSVGPPDRRRFGYVIQDGGLFPHLTARGNVTLLAKHLGWEPARVGQRLDELAALTRFPAAGLDRYPVELSGGQRQRVSLMRALMLDPDIVLLDEPLGALDPMIRSELQDDLREIFRTLDKTVVMVTHDLAEAGFFADRVALFREGRLVQEGAFTELLRAPKDPFVARFVSAQRSTLDVLAADPAQKSEEA